MAADVSNSSLKGDTVPTDTEGFFQTRLLESRKSGFEGNLTKQQQEVLEQLKKKLFDPSFPFAEDAKRELDGDRFFLRFLRATMKDKKGERKFDREEAFNRLERTYKWRNEYGIDELQKHIDAGTWPPGFDKFRSISPALDVVNPETGAVVRFGLFGLFISQVDTNTFTEREWIRHFAFDFLHLMNLLRISSKKHGREISAHHSVPDVSGISLIGVMGRIRFIQLLAQTSADHFPELIEANYFVRAPWIFSKCFAVTRPFLDKETVSKFVMTSGVPTELFRRLLPDNLIPKVYGGESDAILEMPLLSRDKANDD